MCWYLFFAYFETQRAFVRSASTRKTANCNVTRTNTFSFSSEGRAVVLQRSMHHTFISYHVVGTIHQHRKSIIGLLFAQIKLKLNHKTRDTRKRASERASSRKATRLMRCTGREWSSSKAVTNNSWMTVMITGELIATSWLSAEARMKCACKHNESRTPSCSSSLKKR